MISSTLNFTYTVNITQIYLFIFTLGFVRIMKFSNLDMIKDASIASTIYTSIATLVIPGTTSLLANQPRWYKNH